MRTRTDRLDICSKVVDEPLDEADIDRTTEEN